MRPWALILIAIFPAIAAHAAGDRDAAYESLRKDAHVLRLVKEVDEDIRSHRYNAALKKANEAAALAPGNPVVLNARGAILTELKRFAEAEKDLDAAVAADPNAFPPQFNQGEVLFLQKKYADAAKLFTDLQTRFGPLPFLKYNVYLCYALDGQKDKAGEALALIRYPQDDLAWYFAHAVDLILNGKSREGKRLISTAEAINARDSQSYRDTLRDADLLK